MAPLVSIVEIARPPHEVFAVVTDITRFAEWQPDVVRVELRDGSRLATTRRMSGGERTIVQQITRDEPPTTWEVRGVEGPIRAHAAITVEPIGDGTASRITF